MSRSDTQVAIERRSFNTDYRSCDVAAKCPSDQCCIADAPCAILETKLDVQKLCDAANAVAKNNGLTARCRVSGRSRSISVRVHILLLVAFTTIPKPYLFTYRLETCFQWTRWQHVLKRSFSRRCDSLITHSFNHTIFTKEHLFFCISRTEPNTAPKIG